MLLVTDGKSPSPHCGPTTSFTWCPRRPSVYIRQDRYHKGKASLGHTGAHLRFSWIVWMTSEKSITQVLLRLFCEMVWKDVSQLTHQGMAVQEWGRHALRSRSSSTGESNRGWHSWVAQSTQGWNSGRVRVHGQHACAPASSCTYSAENTSLSILFHKDFVCLEKTTKTVNAVKTQGPFCHGENIASRWPSASQKEGHRQEPDLPAAAFWTSLPQGRNEYQWEMSICSLIYLIYAVLS